MANAEEQKKVVDATTLRTRRFYNTFRSLAKAQKSAFRDPGAHGPVLVHRFQLPAPSETDLRDNLHAAFRALGNGQERWQPPEYTPVLHAEWTGPRPGVPVKAPEPENISNSDKYTLLKRYARSRPVILYAQGGGYVFGSTVTARPVVRELVARTEARVLTINYRLCPKHTLPGPMLDLAVAYFSLLAPPASASHEAVNASDIVLAGESAGANACLSLIQFLLHMRRAGIERICFDGKDVPVVLPAGLATLSPAGEFLQSLPSASSASNDWLSMTPPWSLPDWPDEPAELGWPASPPRGSSHADWSALPHPLVCPTAARDWTGAPPMWMSVGEGEGPRDAGLVIAKQAARQGVSVDVDVYEYMTHTFATSMPKLAQSRRVYDNWAEFCMKAVDKEAGSGAGKAKRVLLGDVKTVELGFTSDMDWLSQEDAEKIMKESARRKRDVVYVGQKKVRQKATL